VTTSIRKRGAGRPQVWVSRREPLTPLRQDHGRRQDHNRQSRTQQQPQHAQRWHGRAQPQQQQAAWGGRAASGRRARRKLGRPCRPGARRFSERAPSLRVLPKPFAPCSSLRLQDYGSNHLDASGAELEPSDCDPTCATLPLWLDAYGSNDLLFVLGPLPAVEGGPEPDAAPSSPRGTDAHLVTMQS